MSAFPPPLTREQLSALAIVLGQAIRHNQLVIGVSGPEGRSVTADDWRAVVDEIDYEDAPPALGLRLTVEAEDVDTLSAD